MKIGVITDCFQKPLTEALSLAKNLGFDGVQIYATTGEFSPETLTLVRKTEIKAQLRAYAMEISALCGDMGGYGYQIEADNPERIQKTKAIIDLAVEFETKVITTHIGVIPNDRNHPRYRTMLKALNACGSYAKEMGVTLAIETGPETAQTLKMFLDDTDGGVGVNLDPANLVMVTGQDPIEAVELLSSYIVHTHVKDGVMLKKSDPKIIYDHFAEGGIAALNIADYFRETPLGAGAVDFAAYITALRKIGYGGYLTIERETGADPVADIVTAKNMIGNILCTNGI